MKNGRLAELYWRTPPATVKKWRHKSLTLTLERWDIYLPTSYGINRMGHCSCMGVDESHERRWRLKSPALRLFPHHILLSARGRSYTEVSDLKFKLGVSCAIFIKFLGTCKLLLKCRTVTVGPKYRFNRSLCEVTRRYHYSLQAPCPVHGCIQRLGQYPVSTLRIRGAIFIGTRQTMKWCLQLI